MQKSTEDVLKSPKYRAVVDLRQCSSLA